MREGFKCGSSTEGSWSTQNKAQQPSRVNEKPVQLMLFASMIPSKRAFLQLNIFKEVNGSCLNECDCSFHCTQSLLNIIYLLAAITFLFHFPRKSCRIRSLLYLYEKHWCSKSNLPSKGGEGPALHRIEPSNKGNTNVSKRFHP